MWYIAQDTGTAYIAHHGILGQKWGIRRYQNKDGSLTPEGKMRARQGLDSIEKIASKGQKKAANTISRGRVAGRVAGFLSGSAVATGGLNIGLATGGVPGGIVGGSIGALAGSSASRTANRRFRERAERKAARIQKQYDDLEAEMKKELKSSRPVTQKLLDASQDRANYDIKAVRNAPTNKERDEALSGAAREAKRTGVYATGFKDSSFYINPETGKPFTGTALDSAYKKWLIEQM